LSTRSVPLAIETRGVRRVYKARPNPVVALDGIDLQVEPGEFFGLLGPNGAGKTTLIKILTTLLLPTSGTASVFGFDVARQTMEIRRIMNIVSGGEQSGYGLLQVREQLWMMSQFYGLGNREGWKRVDELIEAVGLGEQRNQKISQLSTGQRQKLNVARGLLNDPWIFFLDEPTLGLDVSAARAVRELMRDWRTAVPGRTILLTSHYMAEVEELCERLAIVDRGRILAIGSPAELKRRVQRESIFRLELDRLTGGPAKLSELPGVVSATVPSRADAEESPDRQTVLVNLVLADDAALGPVVSALGGLGSHIVSLQKSEPSLEDVFVELVGRGFEEGTSGAVPASGTAATPPAGSAPGRRADSSVAVDADRRPANADALPIGEQLEPDEPYEPSEPVGSAR
jgi:ABC-2 type transport system ATP-binding protein